MKLTRTHKMLYVVILAALALTAVLPAFAKSAQAHERPNIVEIAASNPDFSTLVAAVQKAGLVDALDGPKLVTVFAPTNDAFDALAAQLGFSDGMALVNALSAEQLTPILLRNRLGRPLALEVFHGLFNETHGSACKLGQESAAHVAGQHDSQEDQRQCGAGH